MSFSSDVKNELAKQYSKSRHCQIAELTGMFLMEGKLDETGKEILFQTDNQILLEKYVMLLKKAFALDVTKPVNEEDSQRILAAMKLSKEELQNESLPRVANGLII